MSYFLMSLPAWSKYGWITTIGSKMTSHYAEESGSGIREWEEMRFKTTADDGEGGSSDSSATVYSLTDIFTDKCFSLDWTRQMLILYTFKVFGSHIYRLHIIFVEWIRTADLYSPVSQWSPVNFEGQSHLYEWLEKSSRHVPPFIQFLL